MVVATWSMAEASVLTAASVVALSATGFIYIIYYMQCFVSGYRRVSKVVLLHESTQKEMSD